MSQALTLARPYARAAFSVARDAGALPAWSAALGFAARAAAEPSLAALLDNPKLTRDEVITLLSPDGAQEAFGNLLGLLFDNRRLVLLPEIAGLFDELRFEAERTVRAKVTSAAALADSELETIKAALRKRFGREVEVETAVDESLIGGALIDAGDTVIDGTVKGKLARLQAALSH
jgi:F-type H+-transporting ATPase subunit delta